MHVDATSARRTISGRPIVHSAQLLLCALDHWLAYGAGAVQLTRLAVSFRNPAFLGVPIDFEASGADEVRLTARAGDALVLEGTASAQALVSAAPAVASPAAPWSHDPTDVPIERIIR